MIAPGATPKELAEAEGAPIAVAWVDAALHALGERPDDVLTLAALKMNFSLDIDAFGLARFTLVVLPYLAFVHATYARAREVIVKSERFFRDVAEEEASRIFAEGIPPAYAAYGEAIYFTPRFEPYEAESGRGFGPLCRAAMVLHESIHVIDARSGEPAIHVSEWDEPRFSAQTAFESLHNPSAYASFAAQVHEGAFEWPREVRYGAGRRAD